MALASIVSNAQNWVDAANKLSDKPSTKEVVLAPKITEPNKKKQFSNFVFEETFSSLFMCDFLAHVLPSGSGVSSFSSFAIAKFPYNKKGGMAYIVENRFFDVFASNSEIVRHYLVTVSEDGENLYSYVLGQGGTYFFPNGEFGSCAGHEDANAMYLEWTSKYKMNDDFTFFVQKNYSTKDVVIDDKYNIVKVLAEQNSEGIVKMKVWIDEEGEIHSTEAE